VTRDVVYGADRRQRFDVYAPAGASGAPVIFLVHGGGWRHGDKAHGRLVRNKVARWVPAGFVVVSVNYRMLPDTRPVDQARDVARALATAQRMAAQWGGDRARFVAMGHSAGAHLVALLATSPSVAAGQGVTPVLGTVLLDGAALDVPETMRARHPRLFDDAFGADPAYWRAASPFHQAAARTAPMLIVCSTERASPCPQARAFARKLTGLGARMEVLPQALSHAEINEQLGRSPRYTAAVETFLATLHPSLAQRLAAAPRPGR
jgi:acetyl esterase/lipase